MTNTPRPAQTWCAGGRRFFRSLRPAALALLLGLGLWSLAGAYTHIGTNVAVNNGLLFWRNATMTYNISSSTGDSLPNIVPGSDPVGAITQAFQTWQEACAFTFNRGVDTSVTSVDGEDGLNLVTFADTPANRVVLGGNTGRAIITFDFENEIHDVDIAFNPDFNFTSLKSSDDSRQASAHPLATSLINQTGHCLSLMASPIQSSVLMRYVGGRLASTEAGRLGTFLTRDDLIAANVAYPRTGFFSGTGTIAGLVTLNGAKVYGAHVVAVDAATGLAVAGNVTLGSNQGSNYGRYVIRGLAPGSYHVYAEPVDSPYSAGNWEGVPSYGDYWGAAFTSGYQTTFYGSNAAPALVTVAAGATASVNIAVRPGAPAIYPIFDGLLPASAALESASFTDDQLDEALAVHTPLVLAPGERRVVAIGGAGLGDLPDAAFSCSDPAVTLDFSHRRNAVSGDGIGIVGFELAAPTSAAEGPRNLVFKNGDETAVMTGAIYIDPKKTPTGNAVRAGWTDYR